MQMTENQKKAEQQYFSEIWEFYKKYYTPEDSETYWQNVVDEAAEIGNKVNRMGKSLLITIMDEFRLRLKGMKEGKR